MFNQQSWSETFFQTLKVQSDTPYLWIQVAIVIARFGIYLLPLWLIFLSCKGQCRLAVKMGVACALAVILSDAIGYFFPTSRPFALGLSPIWLVHTANSSFPSTHTMILITATLVLFGARSTAAGCFFLMLSILISWSRVFLGLHFPVDVAGAVILAGLNVIILEWAWRKLKVDIPNSHED